MKLLDDKIALITGGGSGIGRAAALCFARGGATVIVASRTASGGAETVRLVEDAGARGELVRADVSREADVAALIQAIEQRHGRLDCAFNCGGIDGPRAETVDIEESDWDQIIDINLKGTMLLLKHEIRSMLKTGGGSIVNMASTSGVKGRPRRAAYNASRHGVIALTKTAAIEYAARGIRVNAVGPGPTDTAVFERMCGGDPENRRRYAEAIPMHRIGQPQEVAEAALWLCSPRASFVVGHVLMVDGGYTAQ